jgi:hypothetical protein
VVDFVHHWHERSFGKGVLVKGLGIGISKFYSWCDRYGKDNDHNVRVEQRMVAQVSRRDEIAVPPSAVQPSLR